MDTNLMPTTDSTPTPEQPQQLTLLPAAHVPVRFRLDADTRRRGMRHVAEIRTMLAARQAMQAAATRRQPPSNRPRRAA